MASIHAAVSVPISFGTRIEPDPKLSVNWAKGIIYGSEWLWSWGSHRYELGADRVLSLKTCASLTTREQCLKAFLFVTVVAALIAWMATVLVGLVLLIVWLMEYDREFQSTAATRLP